MALFYSLAFVWGCSTSQDVFLDELAIAECDLRQACLSSEVLTFNGWTERAACERSARRDWADRLSEGCAYEPAFAQECLDAVAVIAEQCDVSGLFTLPAACEALTCAS